MEKYKKHMRFILTMWYVNTSKEFLSKKGLNSFILTMWYVNCSINLDL